MKSQNQSQGLAASFLTSASGQMDAPRDEIPEIAFVGRSNAGKSSVLNKITGTRNLARTSKTPGRTQLFNYFDLAIGGRLVDLPGYGYAKVPKHLSDAWQRRIASYLEDREQLRGLVLVMDARHPFRDIDLAMIQGCAETELPLLMLLNKSDKLSKNDQRNGFRKGGEVLAFFPPGDRELVNFSARTGEGADQARNWILGKLKRPNPRSIAQE